MNFITCYMHRHLSMYNGLPCEVAGEELDREVLIEDCNAGRNEVIIQVKRKSRRG